MSASLEAAFNLCSAKYRHLLIIWWRMGQDLVGIQTWNRVPKTIPACGLPVSRALTQEEIAAYRIYAIFLEQYDLDYEDFLIHSKILLDRIAFLMHHLLADAQLPSRSFTAQRKYLLSPEHNPYKLGEKYASYVRRRMNWFEPLLKEYRDQFVVHSVKYWPYATLSNPGQVPRPIKRPIGESLVDDTALKKLMDLQGRYEKAIPGLSGVPMNNYELLDFLETHSDDLTEADLRVLSEIRPSSGAKLPDPNQIASHILQFVEFLDENFLKL
jgi:hypothetical protein